MAPDGKGASEQGSQNAAAEVEASVERVPRWDVDQIVTALRAQRARWRDGHQRLREGAGREFPSPQALRRITAGLRGALFPMRLGPSGLRQAWLTRSVPPGSHVTQAQSQHEA